MVPDFRGRIWALGDFLAVLAQTLGTGAFSCCSGPRVGHRWIFLLFRPRRWAPVNFLALPAQTLGTYEFSSKPDSIKLAFSMNCGHNETSLPCEAQEFGPPAPLFLPVPMLWAYGITFPTCTHVLGLYCPPLVLSRSGQRKSPLHVSALSASSATIVRIWRISNPT